jgi:YVTN family beta-propeller protein
MKLCKVFLVALVSSCFVVSCTDEDDVIIDAGDYNDGVLVLNEGSSGQGSVSYISDDLNTIVQDAYTSSNPSDLLGKYVQNIFFDGNKAFIIAGGSNKITVVDRNTFKIIAKIETGLKNPRYGVISNGKAYVTNANNYAAWPVTAGDTGNTDDYIAVINLATYTVDSKIQLNSTANRIVAKNGNLYVTEPYNSDKLVVVNASTSAVTNIIIGLSADSMEEKDGVLYIMRSPSVVQSEIVKVKLTDASITKIAFPSDFRGAKNLDIEQNKIYYTKGTSVYGMSISATEASFVPILTYSSTSAYGKMYAFAVRNNRIYIGDGGDFTANSKAFVYSINGTLEKEFTVGVGPNGFYFN